VAIKEKNEHITLDRLRYPGGYILVLPWF